MNYFKKRIAVFLCLLLAVPTLMGVLPMNSLTAEAATGYIECRYYNIESSKWEDGQYITEYSVSAEVGQEFNVGKLFTYGNASYVGKNISDISGVTYKSSKTSVAKVGKETGIVKVKAEGTTVITITCKGKTVECTLKAYKEGAFGNKSTRNKVTSKANAVINAYNGKITSKNCYNVLKAYNAYDAYVSTKSAIDDGFLGKKVVYDTDNNYYYYERTNKIVVPEMWEISDIYYAVSGYARKNNPIGSGQSNLFQISSVSAKAKSRNFTINLKDKVSAKVIFAIKFNESRDEQVKDDGRGIFRIKVQDTKTGYNYYGYVTANTGSKKLTVNMDYLKLVKGRKYKLWGVNSSWTNGKTFTVK